MDSRICVTAPCLCLSKLRGSVLAGAGTSLTLTAMSDAKSLTVDTTAASGVLTLEAGVTLRP